MKGPKPPRIDLSADERRDLELLIRRFGTPQQLARRARMVLLAADGHSNSHIARVLSVEIETVRLWRQRWREQRDLSLADRSVAARLTDIPRPGRPPTILDEQICRIIALACEAPSRSGRPISQWSGREIADEIIARGIVPTISPRHAARLVKKKGISNPTGSATGSLRPRFQTSTPP